MIIYNEGQERVIQEAVHTFKNTSQQVVQISGGPGTGKSTILLEIFRRLNIPLHRVAPMAFMGQASIVLRMKGFKNAKTIHSWLFTPEEVVKIRDGKTVMNEYFNTPETEVVFVPKPMDDIDAIAIDEGGSVPDYLKAEIESRGKKIIVTGDLDQLPPVGDNPAYLYSGKVLRLTENMRQNAGSSIPYIADRILKGLPIHKGFYGDVLVIEESELTDQMYLNSDIILCGKNNTRDHINKKIRHDLLRIDSDIPLYGERVVCRKNNWNVEIDGINLTNGLTGIIENFPSVYGFDGKKLEIDFKPLIANSVFRNIHIDYNYLTSTHEQRKLLKYNKFSRGDKFEFAYANTTHLSQGSQYANGIYISEYLSKNIQKNLDYTGITRFSNSVIYVIPSKKYF